jgi:outer membrane receptor protein involved in Fe transport
VTAPLLAAARHVRHLAVAVCVQGLLCFACRAENPAEVLELQQVNVVGSTPLPGSGVVLRRLPAHAQVLTGSDLHGGASGNAIDLLERRAAGVSVNAAQGNPFQADIQFRGFTASPLLGTPQGVSVFLDGVRINEPFGDGVNWDLLPPSAISSVQLIPGSNPAFGLNTLGGAIAVYTKSGAGEYPQRPGGSLALSAGSFGRRSLVAESGGRADKWDWYATADRISDRGWARHNPSELGRMFAKLGWQDDETDLDLSLNMADNRLGGSQTLPLSFEDIRADYTYPDVNVNRLFALALKGSHALRAGLLLSASAYLRRYRTRNLSSNVEGDPEAVAPARNDMTAIRQDGAGLGLQLVHTGTLAGLAARRSIGAGIDHGDARLTSASQPAGFSADRGTLGLGEFTPEVDAASSTRYLGVFGSLALDLDPRWTATVSGRYNRADIATQDRSGSAPALDGSHRFERFNPALSLSFDSASSCAAYLSYNEGMRAPTAIELTCADPLAPCKLPNNFLADPPLRAVVSKTVEAGIKVKLDADTSWSAAWFRTDVHDDLQFVATTGVSANSGYFQNVDRTRREGIEWLGATRFGAASWTLSYVFLDATYRSTFAHSSPNNSSAADGSIVVRPGDRIPGLPRHALKIRLEQEAPGGVKIGLNLRAASRIQARGDENNGDAQGSIPGFAVLDFDARWAFAPRFTLVVRVDNLLNRRYSTFGILGRNVFTGPALAYDAANPRIEQFRGHGAPRGAWFGLESRWR